MAAIVRNFDGTIIKNTGDSVIYYFPKTMGHVSNGNVTNFKSVFECGLTMLAVHPIMMLSGVTLALLSLRATSFLAEQ